MISTKKVQELAKIHYDQIVQIKPLVGYEDLNFYLKAKDGQEFILKIAHSAQERPILDLQNKAMQHIEKAKLSVQSPKVIPNKNGEDITAIELEGKQRFMRLLTWIPGQLWGKTHPHSLDLLEHFGQICGEMTQAFQGFSHPAAQWESEWDNAKAIWLEQGAARIPEPQKRQIVQYFVALYKNEVMPRFPNLRRSIIHGDINDYNTLVTADKSKVAGVFDFGDVIESHTIHELAIAAAYGAQQYVEPLVAINHIVSGFHKIYPLTSDEIQVLFPLIAIRICVSVTFSAINRVENPENTYIQISEKPGWDLLEKLYKIRVEGQSNIEVGRFKNA